jgi:hypothetical protein
MNGYMTHLFLAFAVQARGPGVLLGLLIPQSSWPGSSSHLAAFVVTCLWCCRTETCEWSKRRNLKSHT